MILPSIYQSTIFGTSVRPRAPPKATAPVPSGHEMEGARPDLLTACRHAYDARAPSLVAALQGLPHRGHVPYALEAVIDTTLGQGPQMGNKVSFDLARIHEMGHAEAFGDGAFIRIEVYNPIIQPPERWYRLISTTQTGPQPIGPGAAQAPTRPPSLPTHATPRTPTPNTLPWVSGP